MSFDSENSVINLDELWIKNAQKVMNLVSLNRAPTRWTTTTKKPIEIDESTVAGTPCNAGEHTSDPNNCGNYLRCVLGSFRHEYCAPGLHWDEKRGLCDWPSAAKCQQVTGN